MDRQSDAYRGMQPEDTWDGQLDSLDCEAIHMPLDDLAHIYPPEYFESEYNNKQGWDTERNPNGPKTQEEASRAIEQRIDDPNAPDDAGDILAYYEPTDPQQYPNEVREVVVEGAITHRDALLISW